MNTAPQQKNLSHSTLALIPLFGAVLWLGACGQPEPEPEALAVKIISLESQPIDAQPFTQWIDQYNAAHKDVIVSATPVETTVEQLESELISVMSGADALIFPSLAHSALQAMPEAYHPLSASATLFMPTLPVALDAAYVAESGGDSWALPLMLDPVVGVSKPILAQYVHGSGVPDSWGELGTASRWFQGRNHSLPHLVYLNSSPLALGDAFVGMVIGLGFEHYALRANPQPRPQETVMEVRVRNNAVRSFKSLFVGDEGDTVNELPQLTDLAAFVQSDALFTLARRSQVAQLSADQRQQLYAFAPPYEEDIASTAVVSYAVSAAIPLEAANPSDAYTLLNALAQDLEPIARQLHYLPITGYAQDDEILRQPLQNDAIFVLRENPSPLGEKNLLDFYNGKINLQDFETVWKKGYHIPQPTERDGEGMIRRPGDAPRG